MSLVISRCTPMLKPSVWGVLNVLSTDVGCACGGIIGLFNTPNWPHSKYPAGWPMAAAACVRYWAGVSPVRACTLLILMTALAGMGACPGATTLFSLSTPTIGPPPIGHFTPPAAISASVRRFERHGPGRPDAKASIEIKLGDP